MRLIAFDPDTVVPKPKTDWSDWLVSPEGHAAKKAKTSLPRRVSLGAFSKKVGWRPSGLNTGQVKYFVERFPMEFRLASLGRIIVPHLNGDPFQDDEGKLPCPALSSCNALKVLQKKRGELDDSNSNRDVRLALERVFDEGLQVEWQEFPDYMTYMVYYEGAAVQGEVLVKPHIIDTAMLFLAFCDSQRGRALQMKARESDGKENISPQTIVASGPEDLALAAGEAAWVCESEGKSLEQLLMEGCALLDEGFIAAMRGKNTHRFVDAKKLLRNTEMSVLRGLAEWRKGAHFCHANGLSQQWFLSPEWGKLKSHALRPDMLEYSSSRQLTAPDVSQQRSLSLQQCCADIITKLLQQSEITKKADVPKLGRAWVNADVFKEVVETPIPAIEYFDGLRQKHPLAWARVPPGAKLVKRLLIDGESGLRQCFLTALEQVSHNVSGLDFAEQSMGSDFAIVEVKLQTHTAALHAEARRAEEIAAAEAKVKNEAEKENSGGQGVSSSPAEPITPTKILQDKEEQNRIREAAAAEKERQAAIAEKKQEEDEEKNAICNEARITIDNCWTIYNDIPRKGCPPVQRVEKNHQVVYVVPTQSYVRGKPEAQVPLLQMQGLEVLHWATEKDTLVIGVGHDPVVIPDLLAKLKSATEHVEPRWRINGSSEGFGHGAFSS